MCAPSSTHPCVLGVANLTQQTNLVNLDAQSAGKRIFQEARNVGTDVDSGLPNPKTLPLGEGAEAGKGVEAEEGKICTRDRSRSVSRNRSTHLSR
ncbi:hypothetical protein HPB48_022990 [Haemaphysalis longicornis]|uniref:Uncharacterized protein n=1 Tax=Haemaphysalis longicornis TaxID=44386 RepID=A0A9J6F9Q5_HAELO|nr:hypothetical protein HPB48_022990 [Haemaphysalis longicornis]